MGMVPLCVCAAGKAPACLSAAGESRHRSDAVTDNRSRALRLQQLHENPTPSTVQRALSFCLGIQTPFSLDPTAYLGKTFFFNYTNDYE